MIFNIPIESLEERYSSQWNFWFPEEFNRLGIEFQTVYPKPLDSKINQGAFLDIIGTNYFKSMQLAQICKLFELGRVKNEDVFFFHDLWFPGIEQLFYMRDALGLEFKIMGMLHAGTYDEYDFLSQKLMDRWAKKMEESWFQEVDTIFVATEFHKRLLLETGRVDYRNDNIEVTSFPLYMPAIEQINEPQTKEDIIVFPHRMDPEKQPGKFQQLAKGYLKIKYPNWKFLYTKEECKTKQEYYKLLSRAKVAVSFSLQETWGIAQQEAMMRGCIPIVPNRLSYSEMYRPIFRYEDDKDVAEMVEDFILNYDDYTSLISDFEINKKQLKYRNEESISLMVNHMLVKTKKD